MKSTRSGMGKSLYVQRLAEKLQQKQEDLDEDLDESASVHVTIPLHGPMVTPDTILELFKHHMRNPTCCIYHIDIAPNVSVDGWDKCNCILESSNSHTVYGEMLINVHVPTQKACIMILPLTT